MRNTDGPYFASLLFSSSLALITVRTDVLVMVQPTNLGPARPWFGLKQARQCIRVHTGNLRCSSAQVQRMQQGCDIPFFKLKTQIEGRLLNATLQLGWTVELQTKKPMN